MTTHPTPPPKPTDAAPIGIFDSGVGGLSVHQAIRRAMPGENLIYVADSRHAPYGERSSAFITQRAIAISAFLLDQGAKAIVVACNTATVIAVETLRQRFDVPIIALEPAIKPAVAHTQSGVIGVLATRRTVESPAVARLCREHAADKNVLLQACPGFVERVELGDLLSPTTLALVAEHIEPLLAAGADTLVLGCTHYVYLRPAIEAIAGSTVRILDSGDAVARQVMRRLGIQADDHNEEGGERFFTSATSAEVIQRTMTTLLERNVQAQSVAI